MQAPSTRVLGQPLASQPLRSGGHCILVGTMLRRWPDATATPLKPPLPVPQTVPTPAPHSPHFLTSASSTGTTSPDPADVEAGSSSRRQAIGAHSSPNASLSARDKTGKTVSCALSDAARLVPAGKSGLQWLLWPRPFLLWNCECRKPLRWSTGGYF